MTQRHGLIVAATVMVACCGPSEAVHGTERVRRDSSYVLTGDQASLRSEAAHSVATGASPMMVLRPVNGATPYPAGTTIDHDANTITLPSGPAKIFLEGRLSGWETTGDGEMRTYQVQLDSSTFASGSGGPMTNAVQACSTDADCAAAFGPAFSGTYCRHDLGDICENAVQDNSRTDWCIPPNLPQIPVCDPNSLDRRCGSTTLSQQGVPAGPECYMALFVLDLPASAVGTYTIGLMPDGCFIEDESSGLAFPMAKLIPATIETLSCPRIVSSVLGDCSIDPGHPHAPASTSVLLGHDRFRLTFDAMDVSDMIPANFTVGQSGAGTPPSVSSVTVVGDQEVEVRLSRVISLRQYTCVAFSPCEPDTNKVCVGSLPGDVDQNRAINETDLAYLIVNFNSLDPWQSDIGRSGATTAGDIIDWIDVYTGGGSFTPWRNLSILSLCPTAP